MDSLNASSVSLATIRHDLRTILDQILGYVELLSSASGDSDSQPFRQGISDIRSAAQSISSALDVWSSRQPAVQEDENPGGRLVELGNVITRRSRELLEAVKAQGDGHATRDLEQLGTAALGLTVLARQLIRDPEPQQPDAAESKGLILIVDDDEGNRGLLNRRVRREGYSTLMASNGVEALNQLRRRPVDLVLLDIEMPELDGLEVLRQIKQDTVLRDVFVIMVSASDDIPRVANCIELGAEDFLPKPFEPVILRARIHACMDRKRLRASERQRAVELEKQRQVADDLLMNILPRVVAEELKRKNSVDPMYFEDVTILFTDFVGFTKSTENVAAEDLVHLLHKYFTAFDNITERFGLEKLKTIGDSYMCAGGIPVRSNSHPVDAVLAALEFVGFCEAMRDAGDDAGWAIRVGIHTGPVIAGVVGTKKFAFDIWGDSVNFASRMQSGSHPDRINISERTHARVKDFFVCEHRGTVRIKEGREVDMYFVNGVLPRFLADDSSDHPEFARRYSLYFKKEPPTLSSCLFRPPGQT